MKSLIIAAIIALGIPLQALADTCPETHELVRTPGEYSWYSNKMGWEGGFEGLAQGDSTKIGHFMEAQWIQVSNVVENPGYVVCHYKGNFDDEVILFEQKGDDVTLRPTNTQNWNCRINTEYPSTACTCSGLVSQCTF